MAAESNSESGAGGEKAGRGRGPVLGAIIGGLLVGAAAGAFVLAPRLGGASHAPAGSGEHASAAATAESTAVPPTIYTIDNLVLNPAQTGGTRFLMASVALELGNPGLQHDIEVRDAEVRDVILRTLGSKTVGELTNIVQRDSLREELQSKLGASLPPGAIRRVYFPQFVIQ